MQRLEEGWPEPLFYGRLEEGWPELLFYCVYTVLFAGIPLNIRSYTAFIHGSDTPYLGVQKQCVGAKDNTALREATRKSSLLETRRWHPSDRCSSVTFHFTHLCFMCSKMSSYTFTHFKGC